jgi:putative ABC transport system substrate-binding protein
MVGFLSARSARDSALLLPAFHQGLKEAGYVEGQNVAIEYRWADDHYDRLPALAADLVQHKAAVIVALSAPRRLPPRRRPRPFQLSSRSAVTR